MSFDGPGFGHRVKSARTWRKLGVRELALQLGVSDEVVYEIERGERKRAPGKLMLAAIAQAVGEPADWLLAGDDPPWRSTSTGREGSADDQEPADLGDRLRALEGVVDEQGRSMTTALEALTRAIEQLHDQQEAEDPPATAGGSAR